MKVLYTAILAGLAALLVFAVAELPARGDPDAPAHRSVSLVGSPGAGTHYIQNARGDADTPNMVTVILADYRSTDTLGETLVVFTGGVACILILRRKA